jgi:ADP-ribose pyrophosphatase YjhB (NUDIX family)
MYKVFVENRSVLFEKNGIIPENSFSKYLPSLKIEDYFNFAQKLSVNSPTVLPLSKKNLFSDPFFKHFKKIDAAGGIVHHLPSDTYLFIYRNSTWDLPKGKIESNESPENAAKREIEEECGLYGFTNKKKLIETYHTYFAFDKYWLKRTYWFYFTYKGEKDTTPQIEENITATAWKSKNQWDDIKGNTYSSIVDVLKEVN